MVVIMLRASLVILILMYLGSSIQAIDIDKIDESLGKAYEEYIRTGNKSADLVEAFKELQFPGLFRSNYKNDLPAPVICASCKFFIRKILQAARSGISGKIITESLINVCINNGIESSHICRGTIGVHADTLLYIIQQRPELTAGRVCAILLQSLPCPASVKDWSVNVPEKPPKQFEKANIANPLAAEPLKVLQLSDIHYDPEYAAGSNAACNEPLCCQRGSVPAGPEEAAGYWGDYRGCDTPWPVVRESFSHIAITHNALDYVYYTGDIVDHRAWDTNIERNTESIAKVMKQFKTDFGNVPVYPILGNHEPHPVNAFSTEDIKSPEISTQWIFDLAVEQWKWLPEDTHETIKKGGYYTTLTEAGYRIIALNSNVCYTMNWWLIYDDNDPFGQLAWLVQVLTEAEKQGQKVHILSHIPSADVTCWNIWGREYAKIVRRFADTIAAQFNGHTHKKENTIYFGTDNLDDPLSVAFNGGSLTTFHNVNPNYVIYDIDPKTAEVQDYELWTFDIQEANLVPVMGPQWFKLYSFKAAYGVSSLKPADMANLAKEFTRNDTLVEKYNRFKYRNANPGYEGCDENCHLDNLCYMVTSHFAYTKHCEEIKKLWDTENPKHRTTV